MVNRYQPVHLVELVQPVEVIVYSEEFLIFTVGLADWFMASLKSNVNVTFPAFTGLVSLRVRRAKVGAVMSTYKYLGLDAV